MATTDFTQGRIRLNEHGARYLHGLVQADIDAKLKLRLAVRAHPGLSSDQVRQQNAEIARARRVLEEIDRTIADRWGHEG